jgi:glycosyltransferase involved in cell wall biosynthesis
VAALLVLPTYTSGQLGPVASYLSTAGWAAAAERVLGGAWIVSPTGVIDAAEARRRGSARGLATGALPGHRRYRWAPDPAKTLVKDVRGWWRSRHFPLGDPERWRSEHLDFVWQRHELWETGGLDLAQAIGRPSVLFAPTTKVWEAERWGTHRPVWGSYLERIGERPALERADVVACGSDEVADQAIRLGADPAGVVITPTGVDLSLFPEGRPGRDQMRATLGLTDRFVVGWVGSFRPFHAIDRAVDAVTGLDDVALLLVGDGPERPAIEALCRQRNVTVVTTGTVPYADLPAHLAAMDMGLVMGPADGAFHYSPLKLAEYLASGLAVVAPDVDTIRSRVKSGEQALLVPPDDQLALRDAVVDLRDDPSLVGRLGAAGRQVAVDRLSWDEQVRRVRDAAARVAAT